MTKLLQRALETASQLPEEAQDEFARWVLGELAAEQRWSELLEKSGNILSKLADEALAEHRAGKSEPLDPRNL